MLQCPFPEAPEISIEETPCGMCGGDDYEPYAESYDFEYQTCRNLWKFVRCRGCDNVYLNPRPAHEALRTIYPPNYYSYNYEKAINPVALSVKARMDRNRFSSILSMLNRPVETYLDIGCGSGRYLKAVADHGVPKNQIYGIELDPASSRTLSGEEFQVSSLPFEEAEHLPIGYFNLITLFSVLEHMRCPRDVLRQASDLLAPDGLLVFEVPNLLSSNARLFKEFFWGGYHTPRHWNLFSQGTLERICRSLGYRIRAVRKTTGHAFWLWSLHHYLRYGLKWDRIGRTFNPCHCLPGLAVATSVDALRAKFGCETDNMLVFLEKA